METNGVWIKNSTDVKAGIQQSLNTSLADLEELRGEQTLLESRYKSLSEECNKLQKDPGPKHRLSGRPQRTGPQFGALNLEDFQ